MHHPNSCDGHSGEKLCYLPEWVGVRWRTTCMCFITFKLFGHSRGNDIDGGVTLALFVHSLGSDTLVFALGKDFKLRAWSCKVSRGAFTPESYIEKSKMYLCCNLQNGECVMAVDVLDYVPSILVEGEQLNPAGESLC